jgi:hypothetical protein
MGFPKQFPFMALSKSKGVDLDEDTYLLDGNRNPFYKII